MYYVVTHIHLNRVWRRPIVNIPLYFLRKNFILVQRVVYYKD